MNDLARMVSTIVIWSIIAVVLIVLAVFDSRQVVELASMLVFGAVASMVFIWRGYGRGKEEEQRARRKRNEEELDEEDIATLEELLEEQRATRRLQDR